jgi:hypothetical protein
VSGVAAGGVSVRSVSRGTAFLANSFSYVAGATPAASPASGPLAGGVLVTITGPALGTGADVSAVTFGTVAAAIQSQTATQVVIRTGAASAAGSVDITVTAPGGATTIVSGYTYLEAPTIRSLTPRVGLTSAQTTITLFGT